jgi:hypothetical protein
LRHIDGTLSGDLVDQEWFEFQAKCANTNKRDASRQSITLVESGKGKERSAKGEERRAKTQELIVPALRS